MIVFGRERFFNVIGVFWSNSIHFQAAPNAQISALDWNERLIIDNPYTEEPGRVEAQLNLIAENIIDLLINRTKIS